MNKRERVFAAMNNEPTDRPAVGLWYHFPENVTDEELIQYTLRDYRECDLDMIKIMSDGYFNYPNPGIAKVSKAADWYDLKPMGPDCAWIRGQIERVAAIVRELGSECCIFYNVFNPLSYLRFETSDEFVMKWIKADAEAFQHALKVILEDVKSLIKGVLCEAGCDGVYFCVQNAEEKRFTAEEYRQLVRPTELEALVYANSLKDQNILHCCGWAGDKNRMEVWQDYPAKVVNWAVFIEGMSLMEGKKFFGGKCVLGGLDNRPSGTLYSGSDKETAAMIDRWKAENTQPGMMIGADCTVPRGIDRKRIAFVIECSKKKAPLIRA